MRFKCTFQSHSCICSTWLLIFKQNLQVVSNCSKVAVYVKICWVIQFVNAFQPLVDSVIHLLPRRANNSSIQLLNHYFIGTLLLHNFFDESAKGRMGHWDTLAERIAPSFNAVVRSWKVMLDPVEDIPTPDRKQRLTTTAEAHCYNPNCFEIVNVFTQALNIFITERGHELLKTLRNILRRNQRQCLEAFYAKGVFGIFSEPSLQTEDLNSPEVILAKLKKAAQNFCSREAGRKSFVCCHFMVYCHRLWDYPRSLFFNKRKTR